MNYITDYQLDIDRGFQCKVNEKIFQIMFNLSIDEELWFLSHQFEKLLIELELDPNSAVKPYGTCASNHLVYCNSKQQCYDLCQHIVNKCFKPKENNYKPLVQDINFTYNNTLYQFKLKKLDRKYVWYNINNTCTYIMLKNHPDFLKIKEKLGIPIFISNKTEYLGFETPEDAIKFATYIVKNYYSQSNKNYKTYENQLRKERTSLSRGTKPAGSIIHGRRSKASVRCRHIEHKARIGC